MKKIILALAACAAASGLRADEPKSSYAITADFTYTSEYIFRGVKDAGNSFQPSVEVAAGDFNAGLWTNQPITKHQNDEIDLYAGYKFRVNSALSLEAVTTYYWYPEARPSLAQTRDSYEAGVGATLAVAGFSPSLYYYHDFRLEADTLQAAIGYKVPFESIGAAIDTSFFAGTVHARDTTPDAAGPGVHDAYDYYGVDLSIPYRLNANATFTVGVHYARTSNLIGVGGPTGYRSDQSLAFTTGLTVGF